MEHVYSTATPRRFTSNVPTSHVRFAVACSAVLAVLFADALIRPPGALDLAIMHRFQSFGGDRLWVYFEYSDYLTDSSGAVVMWAMLLLVSLAFRWLRVVVALLAVPFAGVINEGIGIIVGRPRPHDDSLRFASLNWEERSFPSGHVVGAVLLYGLIFVVAFSFRSQLARVSVQIACAGIMVVAGIDRIYSGAHWPSDVAAAYALGGLLLIIVLAIYRDAIPLLTWLSHLPIVPGRVRSAALRAISLDRSP